MKFTLTFTQQQIAPAKKTALGKLSQSITLKGFRPGKAPLDLVEQKLDPEQLIQETSALIIPEAYSKYILENKLKPITQPRINLKKMVNDGDWEFEVEIAERPEVKLNDYQKAIKKIKFTPEKDDKDADSKKMNLILETLLKTVTIEVPELLIDQEVNHSLSHLVEQVDKLGLKIDQYLSSLGKTAEQLTADYRKAATENLSLEFIFDAIAKDQQFSISDAELDKVFEKVDSKTVAAIKQNPSEIANLKYGLIKQKVTDFLIKL